MIPYTGSMSGAAAFQDSDMEWASSPRSPSVDIVGNGNTKRVLINEDFLDDFDDDDDGFSSSFDNLQIDGQFFFSCKDDPSISQDAFEGIKMYPPVPTSEPDAVPRRAHVSVSNMETLLHSYQHEEEDEVADDAVDKIGEAMEHQAQRLLVFMKRYRLTLCLKVPIYFWRS